MNHRTYSQTFDYSLMLLATSAIWGFAFVAQSRGGDVLGPFSFNAVRCLIGWLVLQPVIRLLDHMGYGHRPQTPTEARRLWVAGGLIGIVLFIATNSQQLGITYGRSAGKAGFITACYLIFVPILGIFLGKKVRANVWIAVVLAMAGIYLLSVTGSLGFAWTDLLLLVSAFSFAIQILLIDYFVADLDGVRMAAIQFLSCGVLSLIPMIWLESGTSVESIRLWLAAFRDPAGWGSILYAGILSCGVAYTLQIVGQRHVEPTLASLMMSFESVFCLLGGFLLLSERLSLRQILGCAIMFAAILLAQLGGQSQ
ncbi:MAG: DMT family transporter [Butyrivibrio sp.]|nr:DMT family transporter [Butyrivibrio sp.]